MTGLTVDQFRTFFTEVHGVPPFPWQERLLQEVAVSGVWPEQITAPTASGKTSVLDVAIYTLAMSGAGGTKPMCRRIALVVDRRIVVDDAAGHAERIASKIRQEFIAGMNTVAAEVGKALVALGGDGDDPLSVAVLRGGIAVDHEWYRDPLQPTVLLSTVDQVGSRLLHRGYGVSNGLLPIHAGLLANDCLIILDEVHCSTAFHDTLMMVKNFRAFGEHPLDVPFQVVAMTATPVRDGFMGTSDGGLKSFDLDQADFNHSILGKRVSCQKWACLVKAPSYSNAADRVADPYLEAIQVPGVVFPGAAVAVIVNRVSTARAVFRAILGAIQEKRLDGDVILLTGRVRPHERDEVIASWGRRLRSSRRAKAGSADQALEGPLFVVATQCVEVGADFDFDSMVTEICPLDALRQRLGRLNRLGELDPSAGPGSRVVVVVPDPCPKDDPIYGPACRVTYDWLKGKAHLKKAAATKTGVTGWVDIGTRAMDVLLGNEPAASDMVTPRGAAPMLLPVHLDHLVQTNPAPAHVPDLGLYLHGEPGQPNEVTVIWRGDVDFRQMSEPEDRLPGWAGFSPRAMPPAHGEGMAVRIWEARRWLFQRGADKEDAKDYDLEFVEGEGSTAAIRKGNPKLRDGVGALVQVDGAWRPLLDPAALRPGMTVVVPTSVGGCDRYGWDPDCRDEVMDIGDLAWNRAGKPARLRLYRSVFACWGEMASVGLDAMDSLLAAEGTASRREIINGALQALFEAENGPRWLVAVAARLLEAGFDIVSYPWAEGSFILVERATELDGQEASSSSAGVDVLLADHLARVGECGKVFAENVGLEDLADRVGMAGAGHDLGKADPRFQWWLRGADPFGVGLRKLPDLAKGRISMSAEAREAARTVSGYPKGGRHELLSVRMLEAQGIDDSLVLHLVGSHHGACRPLAPWVDDPVPATVLVGKVTVSTDTRLARVGSGVSERFWALIREYGWWGLSYLECLVRLADWKISQEEAMQRKEGKWKL